MDCSRPRSATIASTSTASRRSSASGILAADEGPTGEAAGEVAAGEVARGVGDAIGDGWQPEAIRQAATTGASQRALVETRKRTTAPRPTLWPAGTLRQGIDHRRRSSRGSGDELRRRRPKVVEVRLELAAQASLV